MKRVALSITKASITCLLTLALLLSHAPRNATAEEEQVTFYPTYGYKSAGVWTIPLRVRVHEHITGASRAARLAQRVIGQSLDGHALTAEEQRQFTSRVQKLLTEGESRERVMFTFDHDPRQEQLCIQGPQGRCLSTNGSGIVEGTLTLSEERARALLAAQQSAHGWLTFHAVSPEHTGVGRVQLIPPTGVSVISDIDDTIKITEIPAGKRIVLRNTFLHEYRAAPDMARRYREMGPDVAFHYVSSGPWPMYELLSEFLFSEAVGFPLGSFRMRDMRLSPLSHKFWEDVVSMLTAGAHAPSFSHKVERISEIMEHFKDRHFILIGDSGERDPEVYAEIRKQYPTQVQEIRIRDVGNGGARLEGMTVIPAE